MIAFQRGLLAGGLREATLGDVGLNIRIIIKDRKIGNPLIAGVDRVTDSHVKAVFVKQYRKNLDGFVVLVCQLFAVAGIQFSGCVFVAAE